MVDVLATAGLGLLGGVLGGIGNVSAQRQLARQQGRAIDAYNAQTGQALGNYNAGTQAAIDRYNHDAMLYMNTPEAVNRWLNPNMDYQMGQIAKMNNAQYSAGGQLLSGAAQKALQDRTQQQAQLSWQDAFKHMNTSNQQGLHITENVAGMDTSRLSNVFNAQQGMAANQLSAAMGKAAPNTFGDFMSGLGGGMGAFGGFMKGVADVKKSMRG